MHHVDAIVRGPRELATLPPMINVAMRCRNDAGNRILRPDFPRRTYYPFLERPKELRLKPKGHIPNLVQNERSPIGPEPRGQLAPLFASGKRSANVPE